VVGWEGPSSSFLRACFKEDRVTCEHFFVKIVVSYAPGCNPKTFEILCKIRPLVQTKRSAKVRLQVLGVAVVVVVDSIGTPAHGAAGQPQRGQAWARPDRTPINQSPAASFRAVSGNCWLGGLELLNLAIFCRYETAQSVKSNSNMPKRLNRFVKGGSNVPVVTGVGVGGVGGGAQGDLRQQEWSPGERRLLTPAVSNRYSICSRGFGCPRSRIMSAIAGCNGGWRWGRSRCKLRSSTARMEPGGTPIADAGGSNRYSIRSRGFSCPRSRIMSATEGWIGDGVGKVLEGMPLMNRPPP
jgi:hypothetical protein